MGYESRIYIMLRAEYTNKKTGKKLVSALEVAQFELCVMGENKAFYNVFDREIDFDMYLPGVDDQGREIMEFTRSDCYGDPLKMCDLSALLDVLKQAEAKEHYRRLPPLIAMLQAFVDGAEEWGELKAVRYAH